jgi:hypothetical protein
VFEVARDAWVMKGPWEIGGWRGRGGGGGEGIKPSVRKAIN